MQEFTARREAAAATNPLAGAAEPKRSVKQRLMHEALRLGLMFLYLWVVFGLFVLHERIVRGKLGLGFQAQGFALINAAVLAKVMLVAEDLNLDRGLRGQPLAYAAMGEAALFALLFIAFHVLEHLAVGLWRGSTLAGSVPAIGGGGFAGLATVAAILFVVLIPYFAFRDLGRALGREELRKLLFTRPARGGTVAALPH